MDITRYESDPKINNFKLGEVYNLPAKQKKTFVFIYFFYRNVIQKLFDLVKVPGFAENNFFFRFLKNLTSDNSIVLTFHNRYGCNIIKDKDILSILDYL